MDKETMTPAELRRFFSSSAWVGGAETTAGWEALDLTGVKDGDQVQVWHGESLVGHTEMSQEFPDRGVWRAVIRAKAGQVVWSVRMPAGFVPPDPVRAQMAERQRWDSPET